MSAPIINDMVPAFSPDSKWLAYSSNESGRRDVYVRPFPPPASGQGGRWAISNDGGDTPVWSRASHDLVYLAVDGQVMAVGYSVQGETFVANKPRPWGATLNPNADFDLAPDGKHLVAVLSVQSQATPKPEHEIVFLQNFFDELRRRVPVNK